MYLCIVDIRVSNYLLWLQIRADLITVKIINAQSCWPYILTASNSLEIYLASSAWKDVHQSIVDKSNKQGMT